MIDNLRHHADSDGECDPDCPACIRLIFLTLKETVGWLARRDPLLAKAMLEQLGEKLCSRLKPTSLDHVREREELGSPIGCCVHGIPLAYSCGQCLFPHGGP